MIKRVIALIVGYLLIAVFLISPYLSSYTLIYFIKDYFVSNPPQFGIGSYSFFIESWIARKDFSNPELLKGIKYASISFLVPFLLPIIIGLIAAAAYFSNKKVSIHGKARLANDQDLNKSIFFNKRFLEKNKYPALLIGQIPKGRFKGRYIQYKGQQFLMLYAPTRSGKGVGIVIPNCLFWAQSMVVLDIKLENFIFTAGHRKDVLGQDVFLFCPDGWEAADGTLRSSKYNPLSYIDRSLIKRISELSTIAAIMFPKTGGENDMWTDLSSNLFKGLVLFLLDCETETNKKGEPRYKVTMSQVLKLSIPQTGELLGDFLKAEIDKRNSEENLSLWNKYTKGEGERPSINRLDEETVRLLLQFANQNERQQNNILLTFFSEMAIFGNPVTAAATDESDFDFREIRRKKMTVYFGLSPNAIPVYKKLTNLFMSQMIIENSKTLPEHDRTLKYQVLGLFDEFTSMGAIQIIKESVAYMAGYGMRFMFIAQDQSQLEDPKLYGKEGTKTLLSNCAVELIYPPKDVDDHVKKTSESIGYYDLVQKTTSRNKGKQGSTTTGVQVHKRAVLLPQEIVDLRDEKHEESGISMKQLIMSEFCRPILANKIIYFEDDFFNSRKEYSEKNIPDIPVLVVHQDDDMRSVLKTIYGIDVDEKRIVENEES